MQLGRRFNNSMVGVLTNVREGKGNVKSVSGRGRRRGRQCRTRLAGNIRRVCYKVATGGRGRRGNSYIAGVLAKVSKGNSKRGNLWRTCASWFDFAFFICVFLCLFVGVCYFVWVCRSVSLSH